MGMAAKAGAIIGESPGRKTRPGEAGAGKYTAPSPAQAPFARGAGGGQDRTGSCSRRSTKAGTVSVAGP